MKDNRGYPKDSGKKDDRSIDSQHTTCGQNPGTSSQWNGSNDGQVYSGFIPPNLINVGMYDY